MSVYNKSFSLNTFIALFHYFRSHSADVMFNPDDVSIQSAILEAVLKVSTKAFTSNVTIEF